MSGQTNAPSHGMNGNDLIVVVVDVVAFVVGDLGERREGRAVVVVPSSDSVSLFVTVCAVMMEFRNVESLGNVVVGMSSRGLEGDIVAFQQPKKKSDEKGEKKKKVRRLCFFLGGCVGGLRVLSWARIADPSSQTGLNLTCNAAELQKCNNNNNFAGKLDFIHIWQQQNWAPSILP